MQLLVHESTTAMDDIPAPTAAVRAMCSIWRSRPTPKAHHTPVFNSDRMLALIMVCLYEKPEFWLPIEILKHCIWSWYLQPAKVPRPIPVSRPDAVPVKDTKYSSVEMWDGKRDGQFCTRSLRTGRLIYSSTYVEDVIRDSRSYHTNGKSMEYWPLASGHRVHGVMQRWHSNGVLLEQCLFVDGKRHLLRLMWTDRGVLHKSEWFHHVVLHGLQQTFDDHGELKTCRWYEMGRWRTVPLVDAPDDDVSL